jgi:Spy/CpxP family protein refolding chaperone
MHGMERMARQLDLTEAQQTQIQALHRTYAKAAIRARANMRIQKIDLHELLDAEPVKMDEVKTLLDSMAAQRAELRFLHITLMQDIKKLLTPEQQKKFRSGGGFMMGPGGRMGYGRMGRPEGRRDRD